MIKICPVCQKQFSASPSRERYCSRECFRQDKTTSIEHECLYCGKKFLVQPYLIKEGFGKFCSRLCGVKYHYENGDSAFQQFIQKCKSGEIKQIPWNKQEPIIRNCLICGREMELNGSRKNQIYCSRQCANIGKSKIVGEHHPLFSKVERVCKWCGKIFLVKPAKVKYGEGLFCSRSCLGSWTIRHQGRISKLEKWVCDKLTQAGLNFESQYKIGVYLIDIAFPDLKIAVEVDGRYWHSMAKTMMRDRRKDYYLQEQGWQIYRLRERFIRGDTTRLIKQIKKADVFSSVRKP